MNTIFGKKLSPPTPPTDRDYYTVGDLLTALSDVPTDLRIYLATDASAPNYRAARRVSVHRAVNNEDAVIIYSSLGTFQ